MATNETQLKLKTSASDQPITSSRYFWLCVLRYVENAVVRAITPDIYTHKLTHTVTEQTSFDEYGVTDYQDMLICVDELLNTTYTSDNTKNNVVNLRVRMLTV